VQASAPATVPFDIQTYDDAGVVVMPRFFERDVAARLGGAWDELKASISAGAPGLERSARFVFGVLPGVLNEIYTHPKMVHVANTVLGPDVALYMNRILVKDDHWGGPVQIHQDMPYFNGGQRKLSAFVPLKPTAADGGNGGLKYVVGSHKYGSLSRGTIDRSKFAEMSDLAPTLEVGDVAFMNFLTWHYSENPVVPDDRPLMQIVYQPASDGSFGGQKLGVAAPTLVTGVWQTSHFAEWNVGVTPDA
jgi:hypothetical protein